MCAASTQPMSRTSVAFHIQSVLLALLFGLGFFGYLMPSFGYFTMIPGDLGDARFNSVILEHCYQWLTGQVGQLWNPSFFYPFERVLGLSDNHFGSFWSYALLRILGSSREMAYSGWFLVGTVLNFWVCCWSLKRAGFSIIAAGAGAFTFAFALPMLHQEGHAQLVYRFAVPLALLAWYRALEYRDFGSLLQTVFWLSLQCLCSIYLGVFLVYALIAMFAAYVILQYSPWVHIQPKGRWGPLSLGRREWIWLALALSGAVAMLLLLRQYHQISSEYQIVRSGDELRALLPKPSSYLLADNSLLTRWLGAGVATFAERSEHQLFVGLGVALFAALGSFVALRGFVTPIHLCRLGMVALITLGLLIMSTVTVADFSLYLWWAKLPGVDAIRAVSRIIVVVLFPLAVLVAVGFEWLLRPSVQPSLVTTMCAFVAILMLTAETVGYSPKHFAVRAWVERQTALELRIKADFPQDTILFVTQRQSEAFYLTELDAMIYAQDHQLRTLNGYSGSTLSGYAYPDPCLPADTRLKGYFSFRAVPDSRQQNLLAKLKTVELEPCHKN
jgi:hypothetical protein